MHYENKHAILYRFMTIEARKHYNFSCKINVTTGWVYPLAAATQMTVFGFNGGNAHFQSLLGVTSRLLRN